MSRARGPAFSVIDIFLKLLIPLFLGSQLLSPLLECSLLKLVGTVAESGMSMVVWSLIL